MPQSLTEMFKIRENQIYDLRSNYKNFALQKPETNFMKKSIIATRPHSYGTAYQT